MNWIAATPHLPHIKINTHIRILCTTQVKLCLRACALGVANMRWYYCYLICQFCFEHNELSHLHHRNARELRPSKAYLKNFYPKSNSFNKQSPYLQISDYAIELWPCTFRCWTYFFSYVNKSSYLIFTYFTTKIF